MKNYMSTKRLIISFLLVFIGINVLLSFTNPCSAQSNKPAGTYKSYIKQADLAFAAQDYEDAILLYEKASQAQPEYNYATDQINEIKKILEAGPELKAQLADKNKTTSTSYKILLARADRAYDALDYAGALLLYEKAYQTKPEYIYATDKFDEINTILNAIPDTKAQIFEEIIIKADTLYEQKNYQQAKAEYQKALLLEPSAQLPKERLEQISTVYIDPDDMANFNIALANGDKAIESSDFDRALIFYEAALAIHPNTKFVKTKITETKSQQVAYNLQIEQKEINVASDDKILVSEKTVEVTNPKETSEPVKITGINPIAAKQKSDSVNYAQAIRTGEKAQAAGNYSLALTSFQDAQKIKPTERYPMEQIAEIKAATANQQNNEQKYTAAINTGDKLFAGKEYSSALTAYAEAAELKKNEKYPQDQIAKINKLLEDSQSVDDIYNVAVTEGDRLFGTKDYSAAITAFTKASVLKPAETYPKQRIIEINKIMEETVLARSSDYNKALEVADKLYSRKVFDQAIEAYETASKLNPGDAYPELQIGKIRKYMSDHAFLDLCSQSMIIGKGNEMKFSFSAIDPSLRKNNYILLKAKSTGAGAPKVYLSYGKDNQKNGGIVIRNLDKSTISDFLINISIQDKWFREENNWLSISVETGEIEITKVQIAAGE